MTTPKASILKRLMNQQLSAVVFVQDYVQLQFDGPCLTTYVWPIIRNSENTLSHGSPGFRDALCGLIGSRVSQTTEEENQRLLIHFVNGSSLEVSLREADREGPESAMLQDSSDRTWTVW